MLEALFLKPENTRTQLNIGMIALNRELKVILHLECSTCVGLQLHYTNKTFASPLTVFQTLSALAISFFCFFLHVIMQISNEGM